MTTLPIEDIRNLLITYAYNILGSYEEAKDIVQDAYVKSLDSGFDHVENKRAYLIRTVINLSINRKKRLRHLIDQYPGEWLPEPVATERADLAINRKEILSYSLMVLLEKLNAKQRAVFILKEAFDYDHKEIAAVLEITEENSRKIYSRAKAQLQVSPPAKQSIVSDSHLDKFIEAISSADTRRLERLLKDDAVLISDGGGKAAAASRPLYGKLPVMKFAWGIYQKFYAFDGIKVEKCLINHQPALLYYEEDKLLKCQIFGFADGQIAHIYIIRNPDKLLSLEKKI